ncbi:methyltransferase-like protein 24, partial [Biomphalaria pfeifferi]
EANMAGGLFSSKRLLLLMIVFLMAGTVLFLTLSQTTVEVNKSTHLLQNVVVGEPKKNAGYLIKDQLPADERITEKPIQRKIEVPAQKPAVRRKDIVDNSRAMLYLQQYKELFDEKADLSNVDPNKSSTIAKWWQAAAMIDCMDKETYRRENNSTFHNLGLSNTNTDGFIPRKDGYVNKSQVWKMRTLKSVMKELGHEEIYTRLREMGFREYAVGPHPKTLKEDKFNNQGDSEYVNYFFEQNNNLES